MKRSGLLLMASLAGCSGTQVAGPPAPAAPPAAAARPKPEAAQPSEYANAQYRFTARIPAGYVLTQERRGPGTIVTLMRRTRDSSTEATLTVKAAPLGKGALAGFVERRIARDLRRAQGVSHWEKHEATVGERAGIEVLVERRYATGPYRSRVFCFAEGGNVFILDQTGPDAQLDREKAAFDDLLASLVFADSP